MPFPFLWLEAAATQPTLLCPRVALLVVRRSRDFAQGTDPRSPLVSYTLQFAKNIRDFPMGSFREKESPREPGGGSLGRHSRFTRVG